MKRRNDASRSLRRSERLARTEVAAATARTERPLVTLSVTSLTGGIGIVAGSVGNDIARLVTIGVGWVYAFSRHSTIIENILILQTGQFVSGIR